MRSVTWCETWRKRQRERERERERGRSRWERDEYSELKRGRE